MIQLGSEISLLVLAGGRATRLKSLSQETPKYLMPVNDSQNFADVHLAWVREMGIKTVVLGIGYLGEQVKAYCGRGEKWDLNIHYLEDGPTPLGTGGAVFKSLAFGYSEICVTYGDTLLNFSFDTFVKKFRESHLQGAMTVYENTIEGHVCNATLEGPLVIYDKKRPNSDWKYIDYGFLAFKRSFIESFPQQQPLDLSEPVSAASYKRQILGFPVQEGFWEIGSPEALKRFQDRFRS